MDGEQFDTLVQSLSRGLPRRSVLGILLGGLLAPLLPGSLSEARRRRKDRGRDRRERPDADVQADKKKKKRCPPCKKRKQGKCRKKRPDGTGCPGGTCQAGRCLTAGGTSWSPSNCSGTLCPGGCVDLQTDGNNCGSCDHDCQSGRCVAGTCISPDDLQAAIDAALPGETITLRSGTIRTNAVITKDLTLIGAGAGQTVLDGGEAGTVLTIHPNVTVTVQGLTITKGRTISSSGGIANDGTLTLVDIVVTDNTGEYGGGIENGGTVTLKAASVMSNTAGQWGGGIRNNGGTVTLEDGSRVTNNIVRETSSWWFPGGGIYNDGFGTVTLKAGSSVADNTASHGGGIYNDSGQVTLETRSSVTRNTAYRNGGGIANDPDFGRVSVADETIVTGNQPDNCCCGTVPNCIG